MRVGTFNLRVASYELGHFFLFSVCVSSTGLVCPAFLVKGGNFLRFFISKHTSKLCYTRLQNFLKPGGGGHYRDYLVYLSDGMCRFSGIASGYQKSQKKAISLEPVVKTCQRSKFYYIPFCYNLVNFLCFGVYFSTIFCGHIPVQI